MQRARLRIAIALVATATIVVGVRTIALADLENQQRGGEAGVYTSKLDRLRLVVPRGWFASEQASYPGMLLWMMHSAPEAHIVLTSEPFTRALYCSWPVQCRNSHDALQTKLACAMSAKLKSQRLHVGPVEAGPKENEEAGMPSVWLEYDDGKRFQRQALALTEDRVVSLLLSTGSSEARGGYVRAFEQALRTLHPLTAEEQTPTGATIDAPVVQAVAVPGDGGAGAGALADSATLPDAPLAPAAAAAAPAAAGGTGVPVAVTAAKVPPVGSCPAK